MAPSWPSVNPTSKPFPAHDSWPLIPHKIISLSPHHAPFTCVCASLLRLSPPTHLSSNLFFFNRTSNASLPAQSFWGKLKPKNKEGDLRQQAAQMSMTRQRLLTLVFGEQETLHLVRLHSISSIELTSTLCLA